MTASVKGWCPGALRPMETGDGLVVRIRPPRSQITPAQARAIAGLARAHGQGAVDLTNRANLQIRGVRPASLAPLHEALADLGLLDADPAQEARRNIVLTPLRGDDGQEVLADALAQALAGWDGPALPAKFGFVIDASSSRRALAGLAVDIRIERAAAGLIVRAEGAALGRPARDAGEAVALALALARWFARSGGIGADGRGRMAAHLARGAELPPGLAGTLPPLPATDAPRPGPQAGGFGLGLAFGQCPAGALEWLAGQSDAPIRLAPQRLFLLPGIAALPGAEAQGFLTRPNDPLLRVHACAGTPGCASATVETRALARSLAPLLPPGADLHVSGCAKGCAHPGPARIALAGREGAYDLIAPGRAGDTPALRGLRPEDLPDILRGRLAPPL